MRGPGTSERVFTRQRFTPNYVVYETPLFTRASYKRLGLLYLPKHLVAGEFQFSSFTGSMDVSQCPSDPWWIRMKKMERALANLGVTVD